MISTYQKSLDATAEVVGSTGCYCGRKELIINEYGLYFMSVKIDTDDVEDMNEYTSEAHKIKGFKDIIVDIYI